MQPILRVDQLSKRYYIGARQASYSTLRDSIASAVQNPLRAFRRNGAGNDNTIWALKDVSFEVMPGEVIGVIGHNGAGKSTLLKILSRITDPTSGEVDLWGRVGSLLEVGTGFHPELTGRENVYLNGAVLGMSRGEIRKKFDEIISFAETETFIDTPVKYYSSGMYLRLAFSVAAHLEPEILIVDEVLAVGDAKFQRKCFEKLENVSHDGKTVLIVSHNAPMVLRLCGRVILLAQGAIIANGLPHAVIHQYMSNGEGGTAVRSWPNPSTRPGDSVARLRSIRVMNVSNNVTETVDIQSPVLVEVQYDNLQESIKPTAVLWFKNVHGDCLFATNEFNSTSWRDKPLAKGTVRATCRVPGNFFAEGRVYVLAAVVSYNPDIIHAIETDAVCFDIIDRTRGEGVRGVSTSEWPGLIRPMLEWDIDLAGRGSSLD